MGILPYFTWVVAPGWKAASNFASEGCAGDGRSACTRGCVLGSGAGARLIFNGPDCMVWPLAGMGTRCAEEFDSTECLAGWLADPATATFGSLGLRANSAPQITKAARPKASTERGTIKPLRRASRLRFVRVTDPDNACSTWTAQFLIKDFNRIHASRSCGAQVLLKKAT